MENSDHFHDAIAFWKAQAVMYEHLYLEQRTITDASERKFDRQQRFIARLDLKKQFDKILVKSECV